MFCDLTCLAMFILMIANDSLIMKSDRNILAAYGEFFFNGNINLPSNKLEHK